MLSGRRRHLEAQIWVDPARPPISFSPVNVYDIHPRANGSLDRVSSLIQINRVTTAFVASGVFLYVYAAAIDRYVYVYTVYVCSVSLRKFYGGHA